MPYDPYLRPAYPNELYHHGIKGQKWGVRRFQNPDGTLTADGKKRYLAYGREGHWNKKEVKEYQRNTKREYAQQKADAVKAGFLYKDFAKRADQAQKAYDRDQKRGTEHDSIYENKKLAKYKDAKARAEFWKNKNQESVKAVHEFANNANELLTKYGKKPLKDVKTKTLSNGEQVAKGKLRSEGEVSPAEALARVFLAASGGGVIAGGAYGAVRGFNDMRAVTKYRKNVEADAKFYDDWYRGIYDAFNKDGIKIRLKDPLDELGY